MTEKRKITFYLLTADDTERGKAWKSEESIKAFVVVESTISQNQSTKWLTRLAEQFFGLIKWSKYIVRQSSVSFRRYRRTQQDDQVKPSKTPASDSPHPMSHSNRAAAKRAARRKMMCGQNVIYCSTEATIKWILMTQAASLIAVNHSHRLLSSSSASQRQNRPTIDRAKVFSDDRPSTFSSKECRACRFEWLKLHHHRQRRPVRDTLRKTNSAISWINFVYEKKSF